MSRHTIEAEEPGRYEIVVGYDPPLDSFFGQVIDREVHARLERAQEEREQSYSEAAARGVKPETVEDETAEEDYFTLWVGTTVGEVPTVEALAEALSRYAALTPEMRETLRRDREREAHPPTAYQQMMCDLLNNVTKKCS